MPLGIIMGVFGSVGINVGQNIQANGIQTLPPEQRNRPWKAKQWVTGLAIFLTFSIINFSALTFAPAAVLTPLESIQFITK